MSGIKIPEAVFVSAATGSIKTRSERGLMFKLIIIYFNCLLNFLNYIFRNCANVLIMTILPKKNASIVRLALNILKK